MNLAASSGHVGEQALALSTREDRSRDPLYNQSKMYAELFRTLGWIVSDDPNKALRFRFTLLGDHAAVADIDPKAIFEESVLGINYPNRILAIKGTEASRVFSAILRVAIRLDGYISRDEIIIGILNRNDVTDEDINGIVSLITNLRGSERRLDNAINKMSEQIGIQVNTMENYTRFPLAVLLYCKWFMRIRTKQFYPDGSPTVMYRITKYGQAKVTEIESSIDIRLSDYEAEQPEKQKSLIRMGFFTMLQRANFDISPAIAQIAADKKVLRNEINDKTVLFSPYQTIRPEVADEALSVTQQRHAEVVGKKATAIPISATEKPEQLTTTILLKQNISGNATVAILGSEIERKIAALIERGENDTDIANKLFLEYRLATKEIFYPLVSDLFMILGFKCHTSRAGINYERWDAIVIDDDYSIPIEIKSPTEEAFISIKAVRQALENKIILLSRKSYTTDWDTVTLAVGYNPPNDRAEVSRLITDIRNTFDIRIGIIDFRSLLKLASASVRSVESYFVNEIRNMEGIINVKDI
jgi:hypothetical protein